MAGQYLSSDQGTEAERAVLDHLVAARAILLSLTFTEDGTVADERTRDTALLQCDALWRIIYYANGS